MFGFLIFYTLSFLFENLPFYTKSKRIKAMIKKLILFILSIPFVMEIFSDDVDQSKDDSKKHSFELFI
ncbi:hypothetical protein LEP1GSC103_3290 [Leptospira borgpetersenii serovar Javanica str. UI 09931]|uniref:Uncharacterized protein n=5 Tax=Leptospira borgpetersenii TaxID=174 RepID=M3HM19_LEPBO|nr:hypothetical protein LBBP_02196 [Leptospira borgpetersenii serovar Ballum]EKP15694.1 hypothetical protein LEP1GSC128_2785 [Leptospira borgpetersenii str. 200801926]EKQ90591.1 hypothetical protein LEP1GSC101_0306 [Leptospira borgpetersenii str. UI 09149]EKR01522.1 hypothetical protein LEP1GSC121_4229 [Leptospira borgpetersenii serovar Castellonis str. 200801910]EMF98709.1 hypothetical protein LEP1GSC123_2897 [Leptospira borgpetersenii str. 200701203]EMK11218.1 hypothetical protein LEP1GSC066